MAADRAAEAHERLDAPLVGAGTPVERLLHEGGAESPALAHVAEALAVSAKSVECHLGNVYRKLAIRGRAELPG